MLHSPFSLIYSSINPVYSAPSILFISNKRKGIIFFRGTESLGLQNLLFPFIVSLDIYLQLQISNGTLLILLLKKGK